MLTNVLQDIFERDLNKLINEIKQFANEENLWLTKEGINNSPGNLCLHIIGNLNHYIGFVLGGTSYVRKRDLEFTQKNIPKKDLIHMVEETKTVIKNTVHKLHQEDLDKIYPLEVANVTMTTRYLLVHLITHLNYHLGQINYFRRLIIKN